MVVNLVIRDSLLLVVDVQNGFVNDNSKHVLKPINKLIEHWRSNNGTIVFSRFINPENGPWERLMGWHDCKAGSDTLLHPSLKRGDDFIISKHAYSSWQPEVSELCEKLSFDTVALCGIDTDQCVLISAVDIFQAGLKPLVAADCCASSAGEKFHRAGLLLLERLVGKQQVLTSSQLGSER